jgi:steroid delta-isomerase-like uncharacterized protein
MMGAQTDLFWILISPPGMRTIRPRSLVTWLTMPSIEDVALGRVLQGPSEIASFVEEATRSSSDFRFELVSLLTVGADYANEWVMLGTNDRERPGVPATGRSFRVRGASIGRLDANGRIVENRDYYNLAELLTQLGILPTPPPP